MKYLGIDVHVKTSVWCLLDEAGQIVKRGKVATTAPDLTALLKRLTEADDILAGQEAGKLSYFVHDVCTADGVKLLSFNAYQLRMIASSRKKTVTRDSFWLAKALQTGMTPHPVYVRTGTVRLLRSLLSQRQALLVERRRWLARARAHLEGAGYKTKITRSVTRLLETAVSNPDGLDEYLAQALELCIRMEQGAEKELRDVEKRLFEVGKPIDAIAAAERVWPWVAQIGADRAGFYSYQWLENLVGCNVQNAETVHPQWHAQVGDALLLHPDPRAPRLIIGALEPGRFLLAHSPSDADSELPDARVSWLLQVDALAADRCRFISRFRVAHSGDRQARWAFGPVLLEPVGFAMDRQMLLGVKRLAER